MQPDRNPLPRPSRQLKRCPDCGEPSRLSAFYDPRRRLSLHRCATISVSGHELYRRCRQNPDELACMRSVERARKAASTSAASDRRPRLRDAPGAKSRSAAARRLIAAHLDEYQMLLEPERQRMARQRGQSGWSGWPDLQQPPAVPDTPIPGDQLLRYGVGAAGVAGGLVWATGQVAGLAFGHTWLVEPGRAGPGPGQLRQHLGDPQLAWPADAQQALPGPVGMYATFTATTAGAGGPGGVLRVVGVGDRPD